MECHRTSEIISTLGFHSHSLESDLAAIYYLMKALDDRRCHSFSHYLLRRFNNILIFFATEQRKHRAALRNEAATTQGRKHLNLLNKRCCLHNQ